MHVSCISHTWFIYNLNTILYQHNIYPIGTICTILAWYWRSTPQSFCNPPSCLGIPPLSLDPSLLTWKSLLWRDSRPLRSLVGCILTFPPPPSSAPHFLFPFPQRFPISNTCPPMTTLRYRLHIVRYSQVIGAEVPTVQWNQPFVYVRTYYT
jgi:hypothetical protein